MGLQREKLHLNHNLELCFSLKKGKIINIINSKINITKFFLFPSEREFRQTKRGGTLILHHSCLFCYKLLMSSYLGTHSSIPQVSYDSCTLIGLYSRIVGSSMSSKPNKINMWLWQKNTSIGACIVVWSQKLTVKKRAKCILASSNKNYQLGKSFLITSICSWRKFWALKKTEIR